MNHDEYKKKVGFLLSLISNSKKEEFDESNEKAYKIISDMAGDGEERDLLTILMVISTLLYSSMDDSDVKPITASVVHTIVDLNLHADERNTVYTHANYMIKRIEDTIEKDEKVDG